MLRLLRIPRSVQGFFQPVRELFSKPQWRHFRYVVLALAVAWERHNWTSVWRLVEGVPWRQKLNDFMIQAPWESSKALMALALSTLKRLRPRLGQTLYVLVDGSHIAKRAKKMAGLGYFKDSSTGGWVFGHEFVALGFWFRDYFLPAALAMYWPKKNVPRGYVFRTANQCVAKMIEHLVVPKGLKIVVLFDAYFLNPTVLRAVRARGWSWVSVASSNRNVFLPGGRKSKIHTYRRTCWRKGFKKIIVPAFGRDKTYWAARARSVRLSTVGPVRVVFCKAHRKQTPLALVGPHGSARQLIEHYAQRWAIELFFKDAKQHLGLGHYQTRSPQGVERHLQAVSCAYLLLTHVHLDRVRRAKAKANRGTIARMSLSTAQAQLRYLVLCDIQEMVVQKARRPRALERFMELLQAA